jgi:hypothetical protein
MCGPYLCDLHIDVGARVRVFTIIFIIIIIIIML